MVSSVSKKNPSSTKGKSSRAKNAKRAPPPLLKVVVRRLPHQMKEEEFLTALAAAAADAGMGERGSSWDLIYFTPGKMSKKRGAVTGTAYLHIDRGRGVTADLTLIKLRAAVLVSDVLAVAAKESKHGEKGAVGPTVEAAPFQKLFKQNPKRDARMGTIERDADYKAFCAALQSPAPPLPSADVQADIRESEGKEEPKPQNALLDFLKERGAKKARDSLRAAAVGTAHSSRGSSRRVSSASGSGSGSMSSSSSGAAGVSASAKTSRTAPLTPTKTSRTASLTPTKTASRAPASDPTDRVKKDSEKESPRGQSRSGGGSTAPRGGPATSRPHPPPPPPDSQKSSRSGSSAATAPASTNQSPGPENKGRSATKGSGRTTHRSSKPAASSAPVASATARPSTILSKSNDPKPKNGPTAAAIADARSSTSSPRSSGVGRRGGGGGGGGGGKGRMGGKSSSSNRGKGGGNGGGGGGGDA